MNSRIFVLKLKIIFFFLSIKYTNDQRINNTKTILDNNPKKNLLNNILFVIIHYRNENTFQIKKINKIS